MEARTGFEPVNTGFADPRLTTWLPRLMLEQAKLIKRNGYYTARPFRVQTLNSHFLCLGNEKILRYVVRMQETIRHTNPRRIPRLMATGALLMACAGGCSSPKKTERREAAYAAAEQRIQMQRMAIPMEAVQLLDPYTHPQYTARQAFSWKPFGTEWRIMVVDHEHEYSGFTVKRPYEINPILDGMVLAFDLWPPDAVNGLAIGIIDGKQGDPNQRIALLPVEPYLRDKQLRPAWRSFAIPLTEFNNHVFHIRDGALIEAPSEELDWNDVREFRMVRMIRSAGQPRQMILENFQFAPDTWVRE
jgi:hypothetical protein